jgi:hypothetical protein
MKNTQEILDDFLRSLADVYEAGNKHWLKIHSDSPEDYEPLRECIALLRAEGSVRTLAETWDSIQLTAEGYTKYLPRIRARRALG